MSVSPEMEAQQATRAPRPSTWKRVLGTALVALAAALILLVAGIYRHERQLRAPFDKRQWRRAVINTPLVFLTLTPSRLAMARTMVEGGELLGASRDELIGMLGRPSQAMKAGAKRPQFSEICAWDLGTEERYGSLYAGFDSQGIAQEAWVGATFSREDRLPLQVTRSSEPR